MFAFDDTESMSPKFAVSTGLIGDERMEEVLNIQFQFSKMCVSAKSFLRNTT
jgi:hypothetical protein